MAERWLAVPGFEACYEVSDLGRVRSLDRLVKNRRGYRKVPGQLLRPKSAIAGYEQVALWRGRSPSWLCVHSLVLLAFVGRPGDGQEARHLNGTRSDNRLENLVYTDRATNMRDQFAHKTRIASEWHPQSVLTVDQVRWIRESKQSGASIASLLGVSVSTVCRARKEKTYRALNRDQLPALAG